MQWPKKVGQRCQSVEDGELCCDCKYGGITWDIDMHRDVVPRLVLAFSMGEAADIHAATNHC
jgi:hypothetical protein